MIEPAPLEIGDTIAIVALASWGKEGEVKACKKNLEIQGFKVKLAANINEQWGYFAGTDKSRAQALMDCFLDDDVKAIWCLRGGYGSGRILDLLDYEAIENRPKIFIGMSDITALHLALGQNAHLMTFLGPNANFLFAPSEGKERTFSKEHAWNALLNKPEKTTVFKADKALSKGKAKGVLTGGNLALITAHIGTPWQIQTKGKVLLLEDVSEFTYRIDRFLCQMKQAGLLDEVAGVVLCSWHDCTPQHEHHFELEEVLKNYFNSASYPVLLGLPSGHIEGQSTFLLGKEVELDTDSLTLTIQ